MVSCCCCCVVPGYMISSAKAARRFAFEHTMYDKRRQWWCRIRLEEDLLLPSTWKQILFLTVGDDDNLCVCVCLYVMCVRACDDAYDVDTCSAKESTQRGGNKKSCSAYCDRVGNRISWQLRRAWNNFLDSFRASVEKSPRNELIKHRNEFHVERAYLNPEKKKKNLGRPNE